MKKELINTRHPEVYFENLHNELTDFLRETFFYPILRIPKDYILQMEDEKTKEFKPALEIKQTDEEYKIKVQLPGVHKENISIESENDFLTIVAEFKEEDKEENHEKYHTSEFRYGRYKRMVSFDNPVNADEIKANYNEGILCITVPKKEIEKKDVKHIPIE